jgi:glycosyltransferase involved in cell wall biosynthesis
MRLVFLVRDIHFGGGGERVAINLANWFVEKGYQVIVVSLAVERLSNIFSIDKRVQVKYLNIDFSKGFNIVNKICSVFILRRYFEKCDGQTILLGVGTYPSLLASLLPKHKDIRLIGCQHCSYNALNLGWRIAGRFFFHRLDTLVSLTDRDAPSWRTFNKNTQVIPNAVSFYPEATALLRNKIILSIGRMDYNKGYDLLLDVFEKLTLLNNEWILRIIGEGPLKKKIISRVESSSLKDRIEILSPTNSIMEEYLQASVYLMTSRTEGLPMVLLEAKACGLPIISFNCETGPSEIINDSKDGYLIDCFNVDMMLKKVESLCSDQTKRKEFGANGREDIKRFFPESINIKWETLFQNIVQ